jgi:hypothetical protein
MTEKNIGRFALRAYRKLFIWLDTDTPPTGQSDRDLLVEFLRSELDVCCKVLCPQVLDLPLRSPQASVDPKGVGIGTDLSHDPPRQPDERGGQRLAQAKNSF